MVGTYTEKRGESSQSSVESVMSMVSMVTCALPGPLQSLGQMAASRIMAKTAEAPEQLPTPPATPPANNQDADKTVSAGLGQLGVTDQSTLDLPPSKQKAVLSLATSMAAGMRSPFENPDVDGKNGNGG